MAEQADTEAEGRPVYDRAEPQDTAERALWGAAANPDRTRTRAGRVDAARQAVAIAMRGCILRMPELTEAEIASAIDGYRSEALCGCCSRGNFAGDGKKVPCSECGHAFGVHRPEHW